MGQPLGQPGKLAALVSTIVFCPFLVAFIAFAVYFYSKLADHKYENSSLQIKELEQMLETIESADTLSKYEQIQVQVAQKTRQHRYASFPNQSGAFFIDISHKATKTTPRRPSTDLEYAYFNPAYLANE